MTTGELIFREEDHSYWVAGKRVVNVTRVLADLTDFSRIDPETLERARQEGLAAHRMVELDCAAELDVDALPDWLLPRFAAWRRFLKETGFKVIDSERRLYHPKYGYAGTSDLLGWMDDRLTLIDIKRSLYAGRVIGLQLAGYALLREQSKERVRRRYALLLNENGNYRMEEFNDPNDATVFMSALILYKWKSAQRSAFICPDF